MINLYIIESNIRLSTYLARGQSTNIDTWKLYGSNVVSVNLEYCKGYLGKMSGKSIF